MAKNLENSRNPVFALEMIQTVAAKLASHCRFCCNPVFALEMIQTLTGALARRLIVSPSQSSIRPGDDSDESMNIDELKDVLSRNPVFALEMIQTVMEPR